MQARPYKILSLILGILTLAAIAWGVYQYLIVRSQAERIKELQSFEDVNAPLEHQLVHQQETIDSLKNALMDLELLYQPLQRFQDSAKGIFFEVQVGQYRYTDLSAYRRQLIDLRQSEEGEINRILLGRFDDLEGAEQLRDLVRKLGFRTAFIIGRIDGRLVQPEEAVAALEGSNNTDSQNVY